MGGVKPEKKDGTVFCPISQQSTLCDQKCKSCDWHTKQSIFAWGQRK